MLLFKIRGNKSVNIPLSTSLEETKANISMDERLRGQNFFLGATNKDLSYYPITSKFAEVQDFQFKKNEERKNSEAIRILNHKNHFRRKKNSSKYVIEEEDPVTIKSKLNNF